jgi:hypothetical protein
MFAIGVPPLEATTEDELVLAPLVASESLPGLKLAVCPRAVLEVELLFEFDDEVIDDTAAPARPLEEPV